MTSVADVLNAGETLPVQPTQGPWFAHNTSADWWSIDKGPDEYAPSIGAAWGCLEQNEANARLMAAAPELLSALKTLLSYDEQDAGCIPTDTHLDAQEDARAAIAKAENAAQQAASTQSGGGK